MALRCRVCDNLVIGESFYCDCYQTNICIQCPECGDILPDYPHFNCDCGYSWDNRAYYDDDVEVGDIR